MTVAVANQVYKCGHAHLADQLDESKEHLASLMNSAKDTLCPECCRVEFQLLELDCQAYANLQHMSSEMSAFVIEVSGIIEPLSSILAQNDYQQRAPSIDELTPGGEAFDLPHSVWRKEFWFANTTDPVHVVMLMDHLKQEMDWLASYMPSGKAGMHFGQFIG